MIVTDIRVNIEQGKLRKSAELFGHTPDSAKKETYGNFSDSLSKKWPIFLWLVGFLSFSITAQNRDFTLTQDVPVTVGGDLLEMPWAGGLNGVQVSTIDMDGDGTLDLLLFDKSAQLLKTFLKTEEGWQFAPNYASLFPALEFWQVMVDLDCDGKKDLITANISQTLFYQNTSLPGSLLSFAEPTEINTLGFSGNEIPLKVDVTNLPSFEDIDGDGDLDALTFVPSFGSSIEWHRNLSMERTGTCGNFQFEKITAQWANIRECGDCQTFLFVEGQSCPTDGGVPGGRVTHAGSSLLLKDLNGDDLFDILISEITCSNLIALYNEGDLETPFFASAEINYPIELPVEMPFFPAAYWEALSGNGLPDLIVSQNLSDNEGNQANFSESLWIYQNVGAANAPVYELLTKRFLQEDMIDAGENALPATADFDLDGDLDLLLGSYGQLQEGNMKASLWYFENTGTNARPAFDLVEDDFLGFSSRNVLNLKPQLFDFDRDGLLDLILTYRLPSDNTPVLSWLKGEETDGNLNFNMQEQAIDFAFRPDDFLVFADLNQDAFPDVLIAKWLGNLEYWEGTETGWVEVTESLGGIGRDFAKRAPAFTIGDFDGNSSQDMVMGNAQGFLTLYPDFMAQDSVWVGEEIQLPAFGEDFYSPFFGSRLFPAAFNNDFLLGTRSGGLHYLRNRISANGNEGREKSKFLVYPNPSSAEITIQVEDAFNIAIFDLKGRQMRSFSVEKNQDLSVSVAAYPAGVYIVRAQSAGSVQTVKLVKE